MSALDRRTLAEKGAAIERHLARVEARLPGAPEERVWRAAREGPSDLRAFVAALASLPELAG